MESFEFQAQKLGLFEGSEPRVKKDKERKKVREQQRTV